MVYTARELEIWEQGYHKGYEMGSSVGKMAVRLGREGYQPTTRKPKRKLSAWNKFVKANSKKPRFRYARSNKLNLKKMAVAFRKTPAGKKKRR